ncbi:protein mono-ADP-ribosyltransferase PARP12-like isoform X4 [Palaemon carinicauda]
MHRRTRDLEPHFHFRQRTSPWNTANFSQWNEYEIGPYEKQPRNSPSPKKCINQPYEEENITPESVISLLSEFPGFSASLLQLMEQKQLSPAVVRHIVSTCPKVFSLQGEKVVLKPEISVCTDHLGVEGCGNLSSCKNLHICPKYVADACDDESCTFGHSWETNHNSRVLELLSLKQLPKSDLHKLLKNLIQQTKPKETITVCLAYNADGCIKSDCEELHVCVSFILKYTKCSKPDCKLNHNILDERSCQVLEAHGLSSNETPRDITIALFAANPSLLEKLKSLEQMENSTLEEKKVSQADKNNISDDSSVMHEVLEEEVNEKKIPATSKSETNFENSFEYDHQGSDATCDDTTDSTSEKDQVFPAKSFRSGEKEDEFIEYGSEGNTAKDKGGTQKVSQRRTLWSHYLQGDTVIPEICYYSVESMCKNEASVCPRLHATQHFHWQVSEQGNRWLNLRTAQVLALECAFCDVSQDGVNLPRLDPASVDMSASGLFILMGRDTWQADFKTMTLTNSADTKTLEIRRLCSENIQGHLVKASSFVWWFSDKNNKWVKYGNVDTTGKRDLVSNIDSNDIEKEYIKNNSASVSFRNSRFKYILDFKTMIQTNQKTHVSREVRRRPEQHIQDEESLSKDCDENREFPSNWDPMESTERMKLVQLAPTSAEYQTVINLLSNELHSSYVTKIERIQNSFLWRALQNKIKEMTTIYGDETKVDVRQVFHGTQYSVVPNICNENFDWRLHGTSTGQKFGRGTYFSTSAKYSYCYCSADSNGDKHMFVAKVAVGAITAGNSLMARPPINPATNAPFDSTVDNVQNFTILVKYDKQEYYPEYLLTLK